MSAPNDGQHPEGEAGDQLDQLCTAALMEAGCQRGDHLDAWILLGAVRADDGGKVVAVVSDASLPPWYMRGVLAEADALLGE